MAFRQIIFSSILVTFLGTACASKTRENTVANKQTSEKTAQVPVVIVGAGLTGLVTAYELNKAGIPFIILEEKDHVGGRIETVNYNKAKVETRLDEFFAKAPVLTLLKELQLPLIEGPAHSAIRIDGKVYTYKGTASADEYLNGIFTPDEKTAFLKWNKKTVQLYNEIQEVKTENKPLSPQLKELMNINFEEYVKSSDLPHKVNEWIRITLEPDIATEWNNITALDGIDEMGVFLDRPDGFGENDYHIKGGNDTLPRTLAARLPKDSIWLNCHVSQISQTDDHVTIHYIDGAREHHVLNAKYAAVTVPLYAINKIKFTPSLDAERQKAIDTTQYGNYAKIHFRVEKKVEETWQQYKDGQLFTLLTDSPVGTIYNATNYNEPVGAEDTLYITLLIQGKHAQELVDMSSAKVGKTLKEEMDVLFPRFTDYVTFTDAYLYPKAVAFWPAQLHRSRFDDLANHLREPFGRVLIGGDTTDSSHADGAVQAALRMAGELEELLQKK